jgi:tRNA dimethylallyltransferase
VKEPLVIVVGPTAVGKTEVGIAIAQALDGEIVSGDSRQVYVGMDVGTAKPTAGELALAPHHLIDFLSPDTRLGLAEYQVAAYAAIDAVLGRGKLPLLVGGSGQYVLAVAEGWGVPRVPPNPGLRLTLEAFAALYSPAALHARLASLDPVAAQNLDYRNVRRVVRALEVCLESGQRISDLQRKSPPPYHVLWLGLTRPRAALYARADARIDRMLSDGLVEEVERLLESGFGPDLPAMSALGYREIIEYLRGESTLDEAVARIRRETRRFIRQQATWFRADDPRIRWFDLEHVSASGIVDFVRAWLATAG